jgi:thymidylate kinase
MSTNNKIIAFEGYDGSGKGTLINLFKGHLEDKKIRVVVRKDEPELQPFSNLIEAGGCSRGAEILLRFALEFERIQIVRAELPKYDLLILDRSLISLISWIRNYNLAYNKYSPLVESLGAHLQGSTVIFCDAGFEICWERISQRQSHSKKELLGREVNSRFHKIHREVFDKFNFHDIQKVCIKTEGVNPNDSLKEIIRELGI